MRPENFFVAFLRLEKRPHFNYACLSLSFVILSLTQWSEKRDRRYMLMLMCSQAQPIVVFVTVFVIVFVTVFVIILSLTQWDETRDRRYMLMLMYSQALPIGPTQIILRRSTFLVLWPSDYCLNLDLVHKQCNGVSQLEIRSRHKSERETVLHKFQFGFVKRGIILLKLNVYGANNDVWPTYIKVTLANGVQLGKEGPSHIQSSPPWKATEKPTSST